MEFSDFLWTTFWTITFPIWFPFVIIWFIIRYLIAPIVAGFGVLILKILGWVLIFAALGWSIIGIQYLYNYFNSPTPDSQISPTNKEEEIKNNTPPKDSVSSKLAPTSS